MFLCLSSVLKQKILGLEKNIVAKLKQKKLMERHCQELSVQLNLPQS